LLTIQTMTISDRNLDADKPGAQVCLLQRDVIKARLRDADIHLHDHRHRHGEPMEEWEKDYIVDDDDGKVFTTLQTSTSQQEITSIATTTHQHVREVQMDSSLPADLRAKNVAASGEPHPEDSSMTNSKAFRFEVHVRRTQSQIEKDPELGPISRFLDLVAEELCHSASLPRSQLNVLGLRTETQGVDFVVVKSKGDVHAVESGNHTGADESLLEHLERNSTRTPSTMSIVDMEILPAEKEERSPVEYLRNWEEQLAESTSDLRTGKLADLMQSAYIVPGLGPSGWPKDKSGSLSARLQWSAPGFRLLGAVIALLQLGSVL